MGLAVTRSYANLEDLETPLGELNAVLECPPQSSKALYNRACLRCLLGHSPDDWMADLREAIALSPEEKKFARADDDFSAFWDDPRFREIVGLA